MPTVSGFGILAFFSAWLRDRVNWLAGLRAANEQVRREDLTRRLDRFIEVTTRHERVSMDVDRATAVTETDLRHASDEQELALRQLLLVADDELGEAARAMRSMSLVFQVAARVLASARPAEGMMPWAVEQSTQYFHKLNEFIDLANRKRS